VRTYQI